MNLRPYQGAALTASKDKLAVGVNRQLLKLPTGMGKAVVLAAKPEFMGFKNRSMVGVHREELVKQLAETFKEWNPTRSVGIEMAEQYSNNEDIIIASIPSIGRSNSNRIKAFNPMDFDSIDIDEAHHSVGETYQNFLNYFRIKEDITRLALGVTATPNRADKIGLGDIFQEIVYDYSLLDGIKEGWLSNLIGIRVTTTQDLDKVRTQAGDLNLGDLSDAINTPERNDLVTRAWLEHGKGRQTVVFSVDIQHAKDLAIAFKRYGVACEAIWGDDPHRAEKLDAHRQGHLQVLVNCQILTEGYDDWKIGCIVLARPTKSETLYTQIVGRGTRIPPGIGNLCEARLSGVSIEKEDCILIDVVDVTSKHSLVTLPSLFGMNKDLDLRGKKITQAMQEIEDLRKAKPTLDTTKVTDINKLNAYAQQVDLFKVLFSPEVVQYSEYQWHKVGEDSYLLMLTGDDSVRISKDLLDHWRVTGTILTSVLDFVDSSFADAIRRADNLIRQYGGGSALSIIKRDATWHNDPPTSKQLAALAKWRIVPPIGTTKGEAAKKLTELIMGSRQKRGQI